MAASISNVRLWLTATVFKGGPADLQCTPVVDRECKTRLEIFLKNYPSILSKWTPHLRGPDGHSWSTASVHLCSKGRQLSDPTRINVPPRRPKEHICTPLVDQECPAGPPKWGAHLYGFGGPLENSWEIFLRQVSFRTGFDYLLQDVHY